MTDTIYQGTLSSIPDDGESHHVCIRREAGRVVVYVDGERVPRAD